MTTKITATNEQALSDGRLRCQNRYGIAFDSVQQYQCGREAVELGQRCTICYWGIFAAAV